MGSKTKYSECQTYIWCYSIYRKKEIRDTGMWSTMAQTGTTNWKTG